MKADRSYFFVQKHQKKLGLEEIPLFFVDPL
jgi:hypothetical protein